MGLRPALVGWCLQLVGTEDARLANGHESAQSPLLQLYSLLLCFVSLGVG